MLILKSYIWISQYTWSTTINPMRYLYYIIAKFKNNKLDRSLPLFLMALLLPLLVVPCDCIGLKIIALLRENHLDGIAMVWLSNLFSCYWLILIYLLCSFFLIEYCILYIVGKWCWIKSWIFCLHHLGCYFLKLFIN